MDEVVENKNIFNERTLKAINSSLYTKLLSYYITKDNKKRIIDNMDKILSYFDEIDKGLGFVSENQKEQITREIEKIYKVLISVSNKMQEIIKIKKPLKKHKILSNYTSQIQNLQHRCASILIKIGHKEKLENLDVYSILKIFIFENKDFEIVRMLFSKVPTLVYFEENSLIIQKVFDKYLIHLLDDNKCKCDYYRKMFEYLISLNHMKISKQEKKYFILKIEEKKKEIKKEVKNKELIKEYFDSLNFMIHIIDGENKNNLSKSIDEMNKKYGISSNFNSSCLSYQNPIFTSPYVDFTDKYTITIDSKGTSFIDDAISFEKTNEGYILDVYITDLKPYIQRNSYIDTYARDRGFTVNLPKNYIPMLPVSLSSDISCLKHKNKNSDNQSFMRDTFSLKQGNFRCAVAHRFVFSNNMDLIDFSIFNCLIKVDKNYNYEMIDRIIKKGKNKEELEFIKDLLEFQEKLNKLNLFNKDYHEIKQIKRFLYSDFTSNEYSDSSSASNLISFFMTLTNYFEAEKFKNLDIPFLYCNNKSTSNTDIINKIKLEALDSTKVSEILRIINENFYPSKYSVKNEGHQGLGLSSYCHVTNPIRNYSSLIIQRLEQDFLFTDRIDDRLIYAWEDYLEDLAIELNEKKDKYRSYNFRYYKFYNKNNK